MPTIRAMPDFSPKSRTPSGCSICMRPPQRVDPRVQRSPRWGVVDLDVWIDQEGNFEICRDCAIEIGACVDMIMPEQAAGLRARIVELKEDLEESDTELVTKTAAVSALAGEITAAGQHAAAEFQRGYDLGVSDTLDDAAEGLG